MKAETRGLLTKLFAFGAGSLSAFVFFALAFNGAAMTSYAIWAALSFAGYVSVISGLRRREGLFSYALLPSAVLAILSFTGTVRDMDSVCEFVFWPAYLMSQFALLFAATNLIRTENQYENREGA